MTASRQSTKGRSCKLTYSNPMCPLKAESILWLVAGGQPEQIKSKYEQVWSAIAGLRMEGVIGEET